MMNHPEYCYYNPVGMQDIGDEDEAISQPIERLPFRSAAEPKREIVDVDTLERKPTDGDTAVVVRGLVIEKVRTGVSFCYVGCPYCKKRMIIDDHGNLRCERHACVKGNTYFLISVRFVESATGRSMWLTLFDLCMAGRFRSVNPNFFLCLTLVNLNKSSSHMLYLMREGCSYTHQPLFIANYSFIQLGELEQCRMKTLAQGFNTAAQDSNPGSRSRESDALPLSHYALQYTRMAYKKYIVYVL